jgi:cation:H+ antiporter
MSLSVAILFVAAGLIVLAAGGEILVRGAINTSRKLRISPAVIGLTVVAMATSLPELAVSMLAAHRGSPDVAVGNVVGSNMFNIAVIIGLSAFLFPPLLFRAIKLRFDVSVMIFAAVVLIVFGWDHQLVWWEGLVFMLFLVIFLWIRVRGIREGVEEDPEIISRAQNVISAHGRTSRGVFVSVLLIFVGAALLTGGAELLIRGAVVIARIAGVTERVIAITLVSAGTGLPEFATAIVAGIRRHTAVAIGNVIGSNIFNVFGVLGAVALFDRAPVSVSDRIVPGDALWMLAFSFFVLLPTSKPNRKLSRWEAAVVLAGYVIYVLWLFQR